MRHLEPGPSGAPLLSGGGGTALSKGQIASTRPPGVPWPGARRALGANQHHMAGENAVFVRDNPIRCFCRNDGAPPRGVLGPGS